MRRNVQLMRAINMVSLLAMAALLACASSAGAVVETFWAEVDAEGNVTDGGGTGFMLLGGDDVWFYHETTDWWDQWFRSDPFNPNRRNEIDLTFEIYRLDPDAGDAWAEVTLNWSTPAWADWYMPPWNEDVFIERAEPSLFEGEVFDIGTCEVEPPIHYVIEDYNPLWVSVDIRGYNFLIFGAIDHQCLPKPGDVDLDGFVDGDDLSIIISNWGQSGLGWSGGDLNDNGVVDGPDYSEVLSYWNPPSEPPGEPTPEPATLGLLLIGALALLRRGH